jgi:hypothetical protein
MKSAQAIGRLVTTWHQAEPGLTRQAIAVYGNDSRQTGPFVLQGISEPGLPGPEATQRALTEFDSEIRFSLREFQQRMIGKNAKTR